jgi:hypothetical protein
MNFNLLNAYQMKNYAMVLIVQLLAVVAYGQGYQITGSLADAKNKEALIGAHVHLSNIVSGAAQTAATDIEGAFQFSNLPDGKYLLDITYIGYQPYRRQLELQGASVRLGVLELQEGIELQEVQVVEQVLPVQQRGDTVQYNADAYKTMPDASAEDLIGKMPTVVVEDGKVQAQGEEVTQVLVDGKPFFGNDPTAALRNLPAEVIDKIEIFDQQSQQAQFTGFDDGETSKTINIVTKPNMRSGEFGKLYAGYGYEDRYQAGGNINFFNGDQRLSLIGMFNNINQQNFSAEDLLGVVGSSGRRGGGRGGRGGRGGGPGGGSSSSDFLVGQQDGITSTNAGGINFSDKWGEKVDVSASYFFNQTDNTSEQLIKQEFFNDSDFSELYRESSVSQSQNINHRFSGQLEYAINDKNELSWRPKFTFQSNDGASSILGQYLLGEDTLSSTENQFSAELSTWSFSNDLSWRHKFDKDRRTFSVRLNTGYAPKSGDSYLYSLNAYADEPVDDILDQYALLDVNSWNASANLQYTEPVGDNSMLLLNYRSSYQQEESTKETFDYDESTDEYSLFNQELSNVFSNDYMTQQLGSGLRHRSGGWMLMARANVQWASLINEQSAPVEDTYDNTFLNVLPMAMLRYQFSRSENLRVMYRTNTDLPSISQLQNVLDNSNPLQLTIGNPALEQSYQHSLFARYTRTDTEKSSVFFAMIGGSLTNNYIGSNTYLANSEDPFLDQFEVAEGAQLTIPVNLDGQASVRSLITYGFPVKAIKSNLNLDLSLNYSRTPGKINGEDNITNSTTPGIGLTLSSNISDRVDFTLSSRSSYNSVTSTLLESGSTDYFNQNTRLKLDFILGDGFVFRTDLAHQLYDGFDDAFTQNYFLWNMSIGKKLFKNDRGEVSLTVFDLLNQNNSLARNTTATYIEDVQTNVLQQYVMLSFKYDLRHFRAGS